MQIHLLIPGLLWPVATLIGRASALALGGLATLLGRGRRQVTAFEPSDRQLAAEDPVTFSPSPGRNTEYHPPGGVGVRVDSGVYGGWRVPPHYDSLLAKVIVHAPTRTGAIARMQRALGEFIVGGIATNLSLHRRVLEHPDFQSAQFSTRFLDTLGPVDGPGCEA